MKIEDVQKKEQLKTVRLNLKVTKDVSLWMKTNNVSPQSVFDLSMKDLMKK